MATYAWPSTRAFMPESITWGLRSNDRIFTSPLSGATQTASIPGTRWAASLTFAPDGQASRPALEAFLARARREHRIALHHLKRPTPAGSCNLSGVTLAAAVTQFASSATLAGCGAGNTLKAGDMLGLAGQLLMVADDATANGSGVMAVNFSHEIRKAYTLGSPVVLDKPTALFIQASESTAFPAIAGYYPGMTVELVEVFS
jgi:hypothetical protein